MVLTLTEAYTVLGVSAETSSEDVKKAYKRLALRTHPDKNPDDPEASKKFLRVSEAFKRISDPTSFEDEEDGLPNEEEMEAMFEMMFAEMMGMNGMHEISPEMFAAMEEMMMNGGEDDEVLAAMMFGGHGSFDSSDDDDGEHYGDDELLEMLMHELMRPGNNKRGTSKSSKSGRFPAFAKSSKSRDAKQSKDSSDDSDEWSTESESETEVATKGVTFPSSGSSKSPKSSKLKRDSMERTGSMRMGEGSRRVPPRASSFRGNKSGKVRSTSSDADAKPSHARTRTRTDSDEKIEISLRNAEAKATNMAQRAKDRAAQDAKAAMQLKCDLVVGDRVLVQDRYYPMLWLTAAEFLLFFIC
jgi:curved DNA-binding protein CbpA